MSAKEYVEMYEKAVGDTELIDNVWNAINDVRKYNADLLLDAKLISKDFHKILLARKFYVPQRGWEERDALKGFMNEEYFDLKKVTVEFIDADGLRCPQSVVWSRKYCEKFTKNTEITAEVQVLRKAYHKGKL
jgi:hypothetical protein